MNTLYLRIPSKHGSNWPNGSFAFAVCKEDGAIVREGQQTMAELATQISRSNVVLLIAAPDVTMVDLTIPPMTEAKLRQALPNLVEDQLMGDSKDSVLVAGLKTAGNHRSVAVAGRSWLQQLSSQLFAIGAQQIKAVPAQLSLPWKAGQFVARLEQHQDQICLVIRNGEESGLGMLLPADQSIEETLETVVMLAHDGAIQMLVPAALLTACRNAVKNNPALTDRIVVQEDSWANTVLAARSSSINLMGALNASQSQRIQWQVWKWPLVLATLILLVNIGALNYDYWTLKREAQALTQNMQQTYRTSFPKETVVPSPLEQMRQHLDIAQRGAGQASPDDFTLMLSQFGAAWSSLNAASLPKLVSIEYKEHALVLEVKGDLPQQDLQRALDEKGLVLKKNNADSWQIRSSK